MTFTDRKHCYKFYFFMILFFISGFGLFSTFLNSKELDFSENGFFLVCGIHFLFIGLGFLIILIYYLVTQSKKSYRRFKIEDTKNAWIFVNSFIISICFIYFRPSLEVLVSGCFLLFKIILYSLVGIGYWIYDKKYRTREIVNEIIQLIEKEKKII